MPKALHSWDLPLDKGTFVALALTGKDAPGASPSNSYPTRMSRLLRQGRFTTQQTALCYHPRIQKLSAMAVDQEAFIIVWRFRNPYEQGPKFNTHHPDEAAAFIPT